MIDMDQIEAFYPANLRPFKQNMLREYFQHKLLEIIYDSPFSDRLAFMGGTALRIVHGLARFSEDLDFDNLGMTRDDFASLSDLIKKKIGLLGYRVEVNNSYAGAFRSAVKILDVLYDAGLSGHKQSKILIHVDTVPQNFLYQPEEMILNRFDVFLRIKAVPPAVLLSQKLYALLNRKRTMGRDFYDVAFLLGRVSPDYGYLDQKAGIKNGDALKARLLDFCKDVDLKVMAADVQPFLMDAADVKKVLYFKEYIEGYDWAGEASPK